MLVPRDGTPFPPLETALKIAWLLLCLFASHAAVAQRAVPLKTVAQQRVTVIVTDAHIEPNKPIPAVTVSLTYLDGGTRITDARTATNPRGVAFLDVSSDIAQRDDLRLVVTGAEVKDLAVFEPADGQLHGLAKEATVPLRMLPKGSPALAGAAQIEAVQRRLAQRVSLLEAQTARQQTQLKSLQEQDDARRQAVNAGFEDWARANGLDLASAEQKVLDWARAVEVQPEATAEQRGLAAFAEKNYSEAARQFGAATHQTMALILEQKKKQQEKHRAELAAILSDSRKRANSLQLDKRYHEATAALLEARDFLASEHQEAPLNAGVRDLWLQSIYDAAAAAEAEGETAPAQQSAQLLATAIDQDQLLMREYTSAGDRQGAADAELNLAFALWAQGIRSSSDREAALFEKAVAASRDALAVFERSDAPANWGRAQMSLGLALVSEAERAPSNKAAGLFDQAIAAYRNALQVYTRADHPRGWAGLEMDLGNALLEESTQVPYATAATLDEQAIAAFQEALNVFSRAEVPQYWAHSQMNLGNALVAKAGVAASEKEVASLLQQAIAAYTSALEVQTQAELPQDWARTQMDFGTALEQQGERLAAQQKDLANTLFAQAIAAYRNALTVYSRAELPQDWATAQLNLGNAFLAEAKLAPPHQARDLCEQALTAYADALQVQTRATLPQEWAQTQVNLAEALQFKASHADAAASELLYGQALAAYERAFEVFVRADLPQKWARSRLSFAYTIEASARGAPPDKARARFDRAISAYRDTLDVFTVRDAPQQWALVQFNLGASLASEGSLPLVRGEPDRSTALFERAAQAFRAALTVYSQKDSPQQWSNTQEDLLAVEQEHLFDYEASLSIGRQLFASSPSLDNALGLIEVELTAAHFDECLDTAKSAESGVPPRQAVGRDALVLACAWAAGDKKTAHTAAAALRGETAGLAQGVWEFPGTLHFLSQSSAFAGGRSAWLALFQAVQAGDPAALAESLHQLDALMQD
jgi:tetratricopeptide (TPR) repeat protein